MPVQTFESLPCGLFSRASKGTAISAHQHRETRGVGAVLRNDFINWQQSSDFLHVPKFRAIEIQDQKRLVLTGVTIVGAMQPS